MCCTYVVWHGVEDKLHVVGVEIGSQRFEVVQGAKMLVDGVHIRGSVAVVAFGAVVLVNGGDPYCRDAEIL